jgi:hypothetical protein
LSTALRARNAAGVPVPWAYVRAQLAERWGVPPWEVDEAPAREVALALHLARIEGEAAEYRARCSGRPR